MLIGQSSSACRLESSPESCDLETLQTAHRRIADSFSSRREDQSDTKSQVYFLDHGLSSEDLEALFHCVKQSLQTSSLESLLWTTSYLPLLVCAVEVGYAYEGNGTDFWPLLEKRLEHSFGTMVAFDFQAGSRRQAKSLVALCPARVTGSRCSVTLLGQSRTPLQRRT
jgi:hypothetical protein